MIYLLSLPNATVEAILEGRQTALGVWSISRSSRRMQINDIQSGDTLNLRKIHGRILGKVVVEKVVFFDHPTANDIILIKRNWQHQMDVPDVFFQDRVRERFFRILFLEHPEQFLFPQ